jgi:dipeptidyl aminopeptidase/acylaminoacyl peptidase
MKRRSSLFICSFLLLSLAPCVAESETAVQPLRSLTIDTIMRGPGLTGYSPRGLRWSADGQHVYFQWKQWSDAQEQDYDTWVANRDGSGLRKLSEQEAKSAPPSRDRAEFSRDRKRAVFVDDGDVFLYESAAGRRRNLTSTTAAESNPRFTRDERHVTYVRGNNLFVQSLDDGSVEQVTNIVTSDEKGPNVSLWEEKKETASQQYLRAEERKLLEVIARRAAKREADEAKKKLAHPLKPLELARRESVADLQLSGDGRYVVVQLTIEAEKGKKAVVPAYVTETAYTTDIPSREKVGDAQETSRIGSISTANGAVNWLQHELDPAPGATAANGPANAAVTGSSAAAGTISTSAASAATTAQSVDANATQQAAAAGQRTELAQKSAAAAAHRELGFGTMAWSDDGMHVVVPVRARNNKDWWLLAFDIVTGKTRVLATEHDPAWVRGPEALDRPSFGFLADNETVWFLSESSGWMQLYSVPFGGGALHALTSGKFEIDDVALSSDRRFFYLTTSEASPYERHLYRMPVSGGARVQLTNTPGDHEAIVAPDDASIAEIYSYTNKPPEVFVARAAAGSASVRITTSPAPEFASYPWLDVPIVTIPARDGAKLPARLFKPAGWQRGGPAVIFVHGAGYLQNVHRWWSSYFREYMFHHFLMEHGYVVLDVDYRASAGYGRDWRTAIYRHMGGIDLDDQVDAATWLASDVGVNPKQIGVYGGSYGGFITLMAMFTRPGVFAAGAALRPVTDWAHYNDEYTSDILNTPQEDPQAYRQSSPIYFANGLEGELLICHGVVDTNVHYQDTVRLVQRLIELRKEHWNVAFYPVENHGFVEPTSWADEYKRIFALFERTLK